LIDAILEAENDKLEIGDKVESIPELVSEEEDKKLVGWHGRVVQKRQALMSTRSHQRHLDASACSVE
jgi:hypothetical protein